MTLYTLSVLLHHARIPQQIPIPKQNPFFYIYYKILNSSIYWNASFASSSRPSSEYSIVSSTIVLIAIEVKIEVLLMGKILDGVEVTEVGGTFLLDHFQSGSPK